MEGKPTGENIAAELQTIFEEDQAERLVGWDNIDFPKMRANDAVRLTRAKEIYAQLKAGAITLDGEDLYRLAMLFQHGDTVEDYQMALELANRSAEAGSEAGLALTAAAEDRLLQQIGQKQKWGTQFKKNAEGNWEQSPMQSDEESGVNDEMRAQKLLAPRAQQLEEFLQRNDV